MEVKPLETIYLTKINEVFFRVNASQSALCEMADYFSYTVANSQFNPKVKSGAWDGEIHLLSRRNNTIYVGLAEKILRFAKDYNYDVDCEKIYSPFNYTDEQLNEWIKSLQFPFDVYDYQFEAFKAGIQRRRRLILSPTASGKTAITYMLTRWWYDKFYQEGRKALIIVPTLNLIAQGFQDFKDYSVKNGFDVDANVHTIFAGQSKRTEHPIYISTWQSLQDMPRKFFAPFDYVLVDEAHSAKATSLKKILSNCVNARWRFGTTGTLDGMECNEMLVTGLTGPAFQCTTSKEQMDLGRLANLKIKCLVLKHTEEDRKFLKRATYPEEIDYICADHRRTKFIRNLAMSLKGNTLILFQYVEKHGSIIYKGLETLAAETGRPLYFIYGGTEMEQRELIRKVVETQNNAIMVASVGVYSTGVNIKSIRNIIFASPSKSKVRVLQSIGRALRLCTDKDFATVYDIVDDIAWKSRKNFALVHFEERIKIYSAERFEYTIHSIDLK